MADPPDDLVRSYDRTRTRCPSGSGRDEFLRLACLTYGADDPRTPARRGRRCSPRSPTLGADSVHVAAARADGSALRRLLAEDPALANAEGGPFGWPPLLYLAYARHDPDRSPRP